MADIELTKQQEEIAKKIYIPKWEKIALDTTPLNRDKVREAVTKLYECGKVKPPFYTIFVKSPLQLCYARQAFDNKMEHEQVRDETTPADWVQENVVAEIERLVKENATYTSTDLDAIIYGQHEASWLAYYDFLKQELKQPDLEVLDGLFEVAKQSGWLAVYENVCFVSEKPTEIHLDDQFNLHSTTGAAIAYSDGVKLYAVHGVELEAWIIEEPEKITVQAIDEQRNVEIRRIMMDRYGEARYLFDSGAKCIHQDEFGELYSKEMPDDETLVFVKVKNSTPEPDGTYKFYTLRVPPDITTAKAAVAWTFDTEEQEYQPETES